MHDISPISMCSTPSNALNPRLDLNLSMCILSTVYTATARILTWILSLLSHLGSFCQVALGSALGVETSEMVVFIEDGDNSVVISIAFVTSAAEAAVISSKLEGLQDTLASSLASNGIAIVDVDSKLVETEVAFASFKAIFGRAPPAGMNEAQATLRLAAQMTTVKHSPVKASAASAVKASAASTSAPSSPLGAIAGAAAVAGLLAAVVGALIVKSRREARRETHRQNLALGAISLTPCTVNDLL